MNKFDAKEMFLLSSLLGSDAILLQEKHGQGQVVMNEYLPINCDRSSFEAVGFVLGDKADELFYSVMFPDGWSRKATEHSMYTDIIDDKGRKRGTIGYKAAFYDRWAKASLERRYRISTKNLDGDFLNWGENGYTCDRS